MIAVDTNVLVRLVVEDDKAQTDRAAKFIEKTIRRGESLYVSDIVLCELVWVLDRVYHRPRKDIVFVVGQIASSEHLAVDDAPSVVDALQSYVNEAGDFADYLILERALSAGCQKVATFDRALLKHPKFVAP
ncbi:MAG: type II toxin-antitoxin system VapC family toxin [Deltaproteobacteria bacterium]|nr:type II toxin-antitoxin system VapC family toxin [Deltaproteobacteria bacterium]